MGIHVSALSPMHGPLVFFPDDNLSWGVIYLNDGRGLHTTPNVSLLHVYPKLNQSNTCQAFLSLHVVYQIGNEVMKILHCTFTILNALMNYMHVFNFYTQRRGPMGLVYRNTYHIEHAPVKIRYLCIELE